VTESRTKGSSAVLCLHQKIRGCNALAEAVGVAFSRESERFSLKAL